jgi:hypothetical protein
MRDERGRYISTAVIDELGPEWAKGCDRCEYGIANAPDLTGAVTFYLERWVQSHESKGRIFCDCQAGEAQRTNMRKLAARRIEEARNLPLAREWGAGDVVPELEIAKAKVAEARAKNIPSMHYEGERVTA